MQVFGCVITFQAYGDVAYALDAFQHANGGEKASHATHKGGV